MKQTPTINLDSCWLYAGPVGFGGYGMISVYSEGKQTNVVAHRVMYENMIDLIPDGLQIDHLCRVRLCINPKHLEPVTVRTNVLRGIGPTARNAAKTHCINGHPFSPENTQFIQGGRRCITCRRIRDLRYKRRMRSLAKLQKNH